MHSGDLELIFYRDRKTNTLFVSDIIYVSKHTGYGKIQVGLYLSMYFDAYDRTSRMLDAISLKSEIPPSWYRRYNTFTYEEKETQKLKKKRQAQIPLITVLALQKVR